MHKMKIIEEKKEERKKTAKTKNVMNNTLYVQHEKNANVRSATRNTSNNGHYDRSAFSSHFFLGEN